MNTICEPSNLIKTFREDDCGSMTIFGLYLFAAVLVVGGIAVDMTHLVSERTRLQNTADLAAHAALYVRDTESEEDSKQAALDAVEASMPSNKYGAVIAADDIIFGDWDYASAAFTADHSSRGAVMVTARRAAEKGNPVASFLMQFVGVDDWDVATRSIFTTFRPACMREGFVAEGVVDLQSNNGYSNGFCILSNTYVSLNSNNTFEEGTVVSLPDLDDLDLPKSGFKTNAGLEVALREGRTNIRILNKLDDIRDNILNFGHEYVPDYITNSFVHIQNSKKLGAADLWPGTLNYTNCYGSKLTIESADGPLQQTILFADNCRVMFSAGATLEDVIILNTSTNKDSFSAASGVQIGRDDSCATGGGAQILTYGSVSFPADLRMYGGQIIAMGAIEFAANAGGGEGVSMISGEYITGTSNMEMAFCGSGMEDNFEAEYFRMAR